jgi:predicted AAA+ superfamily ATPase
MIKEFNRDVYKAMQRWKDSCATGKVALVLNGARQVGKTHCVKTFTKEIFSKVYYADLFQEHYRKIIEFIEGKSLNTQEILKLMFPDFSDGKDVVVVFDEIQESALIYNLIRPINREMDCHLIVSGSFLGRILNKGFRTPAGDTLHVKMYGLSFPEFLGAFNVRELYDSADLFGGSSSEVYKELREYFELYCKIGGYPKVVEKYISTQSITVVNEMFEQLVLSICDETARYFGEIQDSAKLYRLLEGVAAILVKGKRKSFNFSSELGNIVQGTNKQNIVNALHWFWKSGILEPCGRVNDCDPDSVIAESLFYFSDIGVGNYLYRWALVADTNVYGVLCENFAYACIRDMQDILPKEPCYATYRTGELDYMFFVRSDGKLVPVGVEVKGGKSAGNTASKLLKSNKISYLVNAKVDTQGGCHENVFTLPLMLLGKFSIFDHIPNDKLIVGERTNVAK